MEEELEDDDEDEDEDSGDEESAPAPALPAEAAITTTPTPTDNNAAVAALRRAAAAATTALAALPGKARRAARAARAEHSHSPRLYLELEFSPSAPPPGPLTARAPVRYRQHMMPFADALISGGGAGGVGVGPAATTGSTATTTTPISAPVGATFTARSMGIDPSRTRPQATSVGAGVPYFSAYKLTLSAGGAAASSTVARVFRAANLEPCCWCPENKRAATVFQSRALTTALRAKHHVLYSPMLDASLLARPRQPAPLAQALALLRQHSAGAAARETSTTTAKTVRQGTLERGSDLTRRLLRGGRRAGEARYFTWALTLRGRLCFGETGTAVLADVLSKHALHSGVARRVLSAGEFCIVPRGLLRRLVEEAGDGDGSGGRGMWDFDEDDGDDQEEEEEEEQEDEEDKSHHLQRRQLVLVLDNNSGTYRPPIETVALAARVLRAQLPGLRVAVVDAPRQPRLLASLHALVPSRLGAP